MTNILDAIKPYCSEITPVGSRVTCNPPPTDTDADYLCRVKPWRKTEFIGVIENNGAVIGGSRPYDEISLNDDDSDSFLSYRLDEINIIATCSHEFHHRFLAAISLAKRLNLMDKADRIAVFQAVLYGNF